MSFERGPSCPPAVEVERLASGETVDAKWTAHIDGCGNCTTYVRELKDNKLLMEAREFIGGGRQLAFDKPVKAWYAAGCKNVWFEISRDFNGKISGDDTEAIRRFNDHVAADDRVDRVMLAVGDGITLCRKR